MATRSRREFLEDAGAGAALAVAAATAPAEATAASPASDARDDARPSADAIDFRWAPLVQQAAIGLPDDPHKSLVGERGDLRYHYARGAGSVDGFDEVVAFGLGGMEREQVVFQALESPAVPIVRTRLERSQAALELVAFATSRPGEGRVDNVLVEVSGRVPGADVVPVVLLRTRSDVRVEDDAVRLGTAAAPFLVASAPLRRQDSREPAVVVELPHRRVALGSPARFFLRFPQEGQPRERVPADLADAAGLLEEARAFWKGYRPFGAAVEWSLPGRHGEFLAACARNILQARETVDGALTFQVGPTCYRGLWIVDGHFILEAARYMGLDEDAQRGLETTWARQRADGGLFAGGGGEHWKDTGIALFSLVRHAELSQDWRYFDAMRPQVLRAVAFLDGLREQARREGGDCGRYGLLARGFGDGGLGGGVRDELTNTLWVLAGLRAVAEAAASRGVTGLEAARRLYGSLRAACFDAMRREMRRHPEGFDYLPMLMRSDPAWEAADPWDRPQPQIAQWALSHAIYPGLVFDPADPVVQGHVALMRSCAREDVPAETGWLPHEGLWTYNAAFVAHAYLWAGLPDEARRTFHGFLNHATPLYCWREEQPLHGSAVARYIGDMPHNWASALCVGYLRHALALEDGRVLRLLCGVGEPELAGGEPWTLRGSPTRFGRVSLDLVPSDGGARWRLDFRRARGPAPGSVRLPARLGARSFERVEGARARAAGGAVEVEPESAAWTAWWRR